ncbi:hypothetical protein ACN47E_006973 [Coniothyrium glycines]
MYHLTSGCVSNTVAGNDNTATSLSAILYYLLNNQSTLNKLRKEIDAFNTADRSITLKDSREISYRQAVLTAALRMHPAISPPLERVVPLGEATICDRFFPDMTIVGMNSWDLYRGTSVLGNDGKVFEPERWLIKDEE